MLLEIPTRLEGAGRIFQGKVLSRKNTRKIGTKGSFYGQNLLKTMIMQITNLYISKKSHHIITVKLAQEMKVQALVKIN